MIILKAYLLLWVVIYAVMIKKAMNQSNMRCFGIFHRDVKHQLPGSILGGYIRHKCDKCGRVKMEEWSSPL